MINWEDVSFANLLIWRDLNRDGVSQADELRGLRELGISSLSLEHTSSVELQHGNLLGLVGEYAHSDGRKLPLVDVWLQIDDSGEELRRRQIHQAFGVPPLEPPEQG